MGHTLIPDDALTSGASRIPLLVRYSRLIDAVDREPRCLQCCSSCLPGYRATLGNVISPATPSSNRVREVSTFRRPWTAWWYGERQLLRYRAQFTQRDRAVLIGGVFSCHVMTGANNIRRSTNCGRRSR